MTSPELSLTEGGNAERLVAEHGHEMKYVPAARKWYRWDGMRWAAEADDAAVMRAAYELARDLPAIGDEARKFRKSSMTTRGVLAAVRLARIFPEMLLQAELFDSDAYSLNTTSGIVDLRSGELHPHDPQAWHSRITGCGYAPDDDCPTWKTFLARTFGDDQELVDYVQELLGLAAIGKVIEHLVAVFFGYGRNGKTVLLETARKVFGDYAQTAPANFLQAGRDKHPTEIARLQGARFVAASEVSGDAAKFDEQRLKNLTGSEELSGRFMHADFVDFEPSHTLFLTVNDRPEVSGGGVGLWDRIKLVPFTHQVRAEDQIKDLQQIMFDREGPAILAWIVAGARRVLARGDNGGIVEMPKTVAQATDDYRDTEDLISLFIAEECQRGEHCQALMGELYPRYTQWCKDGGHRPLAANRLGMALRAKGFAGKKTAGGKRLVLGLRLNGSPAAG
ncbi:MAG TPA: phage/plasmid primase, P4 family [Mycobacterium sp.]|nr:phage/plasmid primase, P4 family [Mycobacterium sp.]HTX94009.1 phage/plasmid primase, P4 family [Mycobacterium sp.]